MDQPQQLTLNYEPGLSRRYSSLRSICAARIYRAVLENVARDTDMAPSNLSVALAGDKGRFFGVDKLELYIEKYQDFEPIYYLIDKFLRDLKAPNKAQVLMRCSAILSEIQAEVRAVKDLP